MLLGCPCTTRRDTSPRRRWHRGRGRCGCAGRGAAPRARRTRVRWPSVRLRLALLARSGLGSRGAGVSFVKRWMPARSWSLRGPCRPSSGVGPACPARRGGRGFGLAASSRARASLMRACRSVASWSRSWAARSSRARSCPSSPAQMCGAALLVAGGVLGGVMASAVRLGACRGGWLCARPAVAGLSAPAITRCCSRACRSRSRSACVGRCARSSPSTWC